MAVSFVERGVLPPLAFVKKLGTRSPAGVFCCGYMSNMGGHKARYLEQHMVSKDHSFLRFDYTNVGKSVSDFGRGQEISFNRWKDDLLSMVDNGISGPLVLLCATLRTAKGPLT